MNWDRLRVFHAVAEAGSFTRAGDLLHLSQPAVSQQMRNLEAAMKNEAFQKLINENIKIYERFRRKKIPIIVLKHHVLMGTKDTADELFKFLEDNLNLVPRSGTTTKRRTGR